MAILVENDQIDKIWEELNNLKISIPKNQTINNCKNCGTESQNFIKHLKEGDIVCPTCGFVIESSIILDEPEWNNYSEDGVVANNSRCGTFLDNTNPYDTGSTFIPKNLWTTHYDADGIKRYTNLAKISIRFSYTSKQRAFDEGKYSFEQVKNLLNLTDTVFNTAKLFWGIILKTDILKRGGNRRGMKACCIFYACLSEKQQRNREDIASAFDIDGSTDFTKGEKIFREIFEKNTTYSWILYKGSENESMYSGYVSRLGLPYKITKIMNAIKEQCKDHLLGIATKSEIAGLLFYACKEIAGFKHPNKSEIAKYIGICNPTLNKVIDILKYFYLNNEDLKKKILLIN